MSEPTIDAFLGRTLGPYRIESLVGQGNRASVYRASSDGQEVAIRVFDRDLSADPDFAERFRAQGTALAGVRHPHLLANSRYAQAGGHAYIVRPYVDGRTLRDLLGAPLPVDEALQLLRPVAAALDFVHGRGLAHGDVKPGNILLPPGDGATLLADLGVAQLLPRGNSLLKAATGRYYGTPEYLSPEQVHGLPLDGRTDSYALAVILYEALVGRPPFRAEGTADTPRTVAARHSTAPPPKPGALNPALGPGVEAALLRGLDKDPERRFASCAALLDALDGARDRTLPVVGMSVARPVAMPRTAPLEPVVTPDTPPAVPVQDAEPAPAEDLAVRHARELQALTETYEARLAGNVEALRDRDATIETLTDELTVARARSVRLAAQVAELELLLRDQEILAARVRELKMALAQAQRDAEGGQAAPSEGPPAARIVIVEPERCGLPPEAGFAVPPGDSVGRHPESTIYINDHFVSARHAQLAWGPSGWLLTDLGTTNGTYVNGQRISGSVSIASGDILRFGRVQASFI